MIEREMERECGSVHVCARVPAYAQLKITKNMCIYFTEYSFHLFQQEKNYLLANHLSPTRLGSLLMAAQQTSYRTDITLQNVHAEILEKCAFLCQL